MPTDWSPDGKVILFFTSQGTKTGLDVFGLPVAGDRKPFVIAQTSFADFGGQFSQSCLGLLSFGDVMQKGAEHVLLAQTDQRRVDVLGAVAAAGEPLSDLRLGQLAPGKKFDAGRCVAVRCNGWLCGLSWHLGDPCAEPIA